MQFWQIFVILGCLLEVTWSHFCTLFGGVFSGVVLDAILELPGRVGGTGGSGRQG